MRTYPVWIVDLMINVTFLDADKCIPCCCPQKGLGMEGERLDFFRNGNHEVTCPGWMHGDGIDAKSPRSPFI